MRSSLTYQPLGLLGLSVGISNSNQPRNARVMSTQMKVSKRRRNVSLNGTPTRLSSSAKTSSKRLWFKTSTSSASLTCWRLSTVPCWSGDRMNPINSVYTWSETYTGIMSYWQKRVKKQMWKPSRNKYWRWSWTRSTNKRVEINRVSALRRTCSLTKRAFANWWLCGSRPYLYRILNPIHL